MSDTVWAKAKTEIRRRGWWQGDFYDHRQPLDVAPVCLGGAICAATTGHPANDLHPAADDAISRVMDRLGMQVAAWNDADSRTVEDVYALLDELDVAERAS